MPKNKKVNQPIEDITLHSFLNFNFPSSKKTKFTIKEKEILRPIAEVLAMLDGNAFFGMSLDDQGNDLWYEQYLPEAYRVYQTNGGAAGWAGETSWMKHIVPENDSVKEAYQNWQLIKMLSTKKK